MEQSPKLWNGKKKEQSVGQGIACYNPCIFKKARRLYMCTRISLEWYSKPSDADSLQGEDWRYKAWDRSAFY